MLMLKVLEKVLQLRRRQIGILEVSLNFFWAAVLPESRLGTLEWWRSIAALLDPLSL